MPDPDWYKPHWYTHEGELIDTGSLEEDVRVSGMERELYHRVAEATVGPYWISTVFLGIDHSFGMGPPLLFETMVFDNSNMVHNSIVDREMAEADEELTRRYSTWAQAEAGHVEVMAAVQAIHAAERATRR